ncbi:MFS transporter [Actinophytocola sp.]|uniref:MFS transporter n=1 Tax=Actinophytocola sp. TaxID=1872138 RepID=UPI002ED438D6
MTSPARSPWMIFSVLAVTQFMVVLDASIVYVALPSIQRDLHFSQADLSWVMNAYILAFGGVMMLGGRMADLLGRRRVLLAGLVWFGLASLACALAATPWQIVAARAAQGLGAAFVAPSALALVTDTFPEGPTRFKALGIFGSIGGFAGAAGTLIGGLLTTISWQWAFLVNIPIVLAILVIGPRLLPSARPAATGGIDLVGIASSVGGLCLLLLGILRGGVQGWGSTPVLLEFAGALVLLAAFVFRQAKARAPLVPRALVATRGVMIGNGANVMAGALLFGVYLVLTLFLQTVRGYTPLQAALWTLPISVSLFLGSNLVPRLFGRLSPRGALGMALGLQAVGLVWWALSLASEGLLLTSFLLPAMVWGFGCGGALVAAFVVCTSGVRGQEMGAASGLVSTTLQVGGALGVAVLTTLSEVDDSANGVVSTAHGQSIALWGASAFAVVGVVLMLWLRRADPAPAVTPAVRAGTRS